MSTELATRCSCNFTSERLENGTFRCPDNPKDVVIFARLLGLPSEDVFASALIDFLKDWVQSPGGSEIVLGNLSLAVSGSCPVEIGSFSEDPCPSVITVAVSDDDDDVGAIVGGVIGGVALIVIIIVVIVIIILIIRSRRTKKWEPKK